jgi:hypothetical protein
MRPHEGLREAVDGGQVGRSAKSRIGGEDEHHVPAAASIPWWRP